jgi:nucleoside-diphosphate-sugar epimerase
MKTALIGYTGFVGGNVYNQLEFDDVYNSKNIKEIKGKKYDLVISAGVSAVKWLANQKPKEDWQNIEKLLNLLITAKIKYLVWISTVDVYPNPSGVDEKTEIDYKKVQPYGQNRFLAEEFIRKNFSFYSIVRLPGLFGFGIKKNLIFDIIHDQYNDFVHPESIFQFYNLKNIGSDLKIVIKNEIPLINFATEPISVQEIGRYVLGKKIKGNKNLKKVFYDMKTLYADFFNKIGDYLYKKDEILQEIKNFIKIEKSKL